MSTRIVDRFCHRHPAVEVATVPEPRSLIAPVDERIAQLRQAFNFVHVSIDPDFVPEDCEWCHGQETTAVRVYGDPIHDEHIDGAIEEVEVGMRCALNKRGPIWQAGYESRTDKDIRLEVAA